MADFTAAQIYGLGTTSSNWANLLGRTLREQADVARTLPGAGQTAQRHAARLASVSHELRAVGVDDALHLLMLAVTQLRRAATPGSERDTYTPSKSAQLTINKLGTTEAFVSWNEFVTALAAGEIRDLAGAFSQAAADREAAKRTAEEAGRKLDVANADRNRLSVTLAATEGTLTDTRARLAEANRKVEFLSGQLAAASDERSPASDATEPTPDVPDRPSAELLERVLENPNTFHAVPNSPGVALRLRGGVPTYVTRLRVGGKQEVVWFVPESQVTLARAIEWAAEQKEKS